jgi:hypothetical protein
MTLDGSGAGLRAQHHSAASLALISSSKLVGHLFTLRGLSRNRSYVTVPRKLIYVFLFIGVPQQLMPPSSEPRVTTNSAPQFSHEYRLPVSVAKFLTSSVF